MSILKVDEWKGVQNWYIADVKTWTGWRGMAKVLGCDSLGQFIGCLRNKYHAQIDSYNPNNDLLLFSFVEYKNAHQLKLDVNRIARKQNFQVEKWQTSF